MNYQMGKGMMKMSNSSLVSYKKLSPNNSGARKSKIDRITPHCVVGQVSVESLGNIFAQKAKQASSNYGIGADGRVGMYVEEKNRSWCSSSSANDNRAVTIECASDATHPYAFKTVVYEKLIDLCVDICKRNGKKKLIWIADKNKALSYSPKSDEMLLTVHRWFKNKACPGDWLMARMDDLASKVTKKLNKKTASDTSKKTSTRRLESAREKSNAVVGIYRVTASSLNMRTEAGTQGGDDTILTSIKKGETVHCYGYYNVVKKVKWLLVQYYNFQGYVSSEYLEKA